MRARRVVVVGGGVAGAATAWSLACAHGAEVLLLERARQPGTHSTGRNAAILRTAVPEAPWHALARASAQFYAAPPAAVAAAPLARPCGLFLCTADDAAASLAGWAEDPRRGGEARELPLARLRAEWPLLGDGVARCWFVASDGVVDVHAALHGMLAAARSAGAVIRTSVTAVDLLREGGGAVRGVRVVGAGAPLPEAVEADAVVLAGGGWATEPAAAVGLPLPLSPRRRHLAVTAPLPGLRADAPVVWILGDEFYFRPESGGLLLSPCDETEVEPGEGERTDEAALEVAARKTRRWLPAIGDAQLAHCWAAMRTFAADALPVLGPDPRAPGLFWAAALGGHGVSCAPAVGTLVADAVAGAPATDLARACLLERLLNPSAGAAAPAGASRAE